MVRQNRLIESARDQAAAALEANHARLNDTMRAYEEALDQQLQTVLNSTITEDTLNQEMEIAARGQRDRIHGLTAIPPLHMDKDLLQLQTRCAILNQQAEDLQSQLRAYREQDAEGKIARLRRKVEELQKKLEEQTDASEAMSQENSMLHRDKEKLQSRAAKVDSELKRMKRILQLDEKEAEVNKKVMRGLKERVDTAEREIERLECKRKDSISPDRVVTGILKRPGASPLSTQRTAGIDAPTSSQPTPKKSRTRKEKWSDLAKEHTQHSGFLNPLAHPSLLPTRTGVKKQSSLPQWQGGRTLFSITLCTA